MKQVIREVAQHMSISDNQIRKWKHRKAVPHKHRLPMLAAAGRMGKTILPDDFEFAAPKAAPKPKKRA